LEIDSWRWQCLSERYALLMELNFMDTIAQYGTPLYLIDKFNARRVYIQNMLRFFNSELGLRSDNTDIAPVVKYK
jgi:hypothetical protein